MNDSPAIQSDGVIAPDSKCFLLECCGPKHVNFPHGLQEDQDFLTLYCPRRNREQVLVDLGNRLTEEANCLTQSVNTIESALQACQRQLQEFHSQILLREQSKECYWVKPG